MTGYQALLDAKVHRGAEHGFDPTWMPDDLFPFQAEMVEWAVRQGRCALFEDCGLGKTIQLLVWAENVAAHSDGRVLVLSPLAVAAQTVREAEKFGIEVGRSSDGALPESRVVVTNYERLHLLDPADFAGVVCDESSILKSFDGARRREVTAFMRRMPYRLLCTATAAPNDYHELGTSSEALGFLGRTDMLTRFFVTDQNNSVARRQYGEAPKWRFKGHAQTPFWRWVCSWARALRKPSDLGYEDGAFTLPELRIATHVVEPTAPPDDRLFSVPATTLYDQRQERRRAMGERCERLAELVTHDEPALVWCHLNDEADELERMIPGAVQVSGADSDAAKEAKFLAFCDGDVRVLVTKPQIGAWGLNFQHCAHVALFPSHSYEQYYQGIRRCWRFGQTRDVRVDIVLTEGERKVMENLARKARAADAMFDSLVREMRDAESVGRRPEGDVAVEAPGWL